MPHVRTDAPVISFQNGLRNPDRLRRAMPDHHVVPGMVGFNVVWEQGSPSSQSTAPSGAAMRQATSGALAILREPPCHAIAQALTGSGLDLHQDRDMAAVQWAKLLLNLNNAANALSGLPLRAQLQSRPYRQVLAAAMTEAWAVLDAAGIVPRPVGRMKPRLAPWILPRPD